MACHTEFCHTDPAAYWDSVHRGKEPSTTSWYETAPATSLAVLDALGVNRNDRMLDVGAGARGLAGPLLQRGFRHVSALDVSHAALQAARDELAGRAGKVEWIVTNVVDWRPPHRWDVWHDRAVFHFLPDDEQRKRYRRVLEQAVVPGGAVVVATFAADGPQQCSGLPTSRYDAGELAAALGDGLEPVVTRRVEHRTPGGNLQPFTYLGLRRR